MPAALCAAGHHPKRKIRIWFRALPAGDEQFVRPCVGGRVSATLSIREAVRKIPSGDLRRVAQESLANHGAGRTGLRSKAHRYDAGQNAAIALRIIAVPESIDVHFKNIVAMHKPIERDTAVGLLRFAPDRQQAGSAS